MAATCQLPEFIAGFDKNPFHVSLYLDVFVSFMYLTYIERERETVSAICCVSSEPHESIGSAAANRTVLICPSARNKRIV